MPLQTPAAPKANYNVLPGDSSPQINHGQFGFLAEMDSRPFYKVRGYSGVQGPLSCYRTNRSFLCRMCSGSPSQIAIGTELVMLTSGEWVYNVCQNPEAQNYLRQQAT